MSKNTKETVPANTVLVKDTYKKLVGDTTDINGWIINEDNLVIGRQYVLSGSAQSYGNSTPYFKMGSVVLWQGLTGPSYHGPLQLFTEHFVATAPNIRLHVKSKDPGAWVEFEGLWLAEEMPDTPYIRISTQQNNNNDDHEGMVYNPLTKEWSWF